MLTHALPTAVAIAAVLTAQPATAQDRPWMLDASPASAHADRWFTHLAEQDRPVDANPPAVAIHAAVAFVGPALLAALPVDRDRPAFLVPAASMAAMHGALAMSYSVPHDPGPRRAWGAYGTLGTSLAIVGTTTIGIGIEDRDARLVAGGGLLVAGLASFFIVDLLLPPPSAWELRGAYRAADFAERAAILHEHLLARDAARRQRLAVGGAVQLVLGVGAMLLMAPSLDSEANEDNFHALLPTMMGASFAFGGLLALVLAPLLPDPALSAFEAGVAPPR